MRTAWRQYRGYIDGETQSQRKTYSLTQEIEFEEIYFRTHSVHTHTHTADLHQPHKRRRWRRNNTAQRDTTHKYIIIIKCDSVAAGSEWENTSVFAECHIFSNWSKIHAYRKWDARERQAHTAHGTHESNVKYISARCDVRESVKDSSEFLKTAKKNIY